MTPPDFRRWADQIGFAAVTIAVVGVGFVQGRTPVTAPFDAVGGAGTAPLNATVACLGFAATLLLSSAVFLFDLVRDRPPRDAPTTGETVAAIVPVYGDASILHRSVESLLASRYRDVRVYVVCEPGDAATIDRARELAERDRVSLLINDRDPGSKAAAVDYAVDATGGDYIGVFDADERVHPEFVASAVAELGTCDLVQGRTLPRPGGPFETTAYYESVLLGYLTHRLLGVLTGFRMAASNAVVMRRSAYDRVGGYDPTMLTEDFDFAFRCYEAGVRVREELSYPSEIDAAHTLADWWGQRKRWMTGYAQVFHRRLRWVRPVDAPRSVLSLLICGGAVLGNLVLLSLVPQLIVLATVGAGATVGIVLGTVWAIALGVRWIDARADHVDGVGVGWLFVPLVLPLYSLAAIKGIVEYPLSWEGEWYRVRKEA